MSSTSLSKRPHDSRATFTFSNPWLAVLDLELSPGSLSGVAPGHTGWCSDIMPSHTWAPIDTARSRAVSAVWGSRGGTRARFLRGAAGLQGVESRRHHFSSPTKKAVYREAASSTTCSRQRAVHQTIWTANTSRTYEGPP